VRRELDRRVGQANRPAIHQVQPLDLFVCQGSERTPQCPGRLDVHHLRHGDTGARSDDRDDHKRTGPGPGYLRQDRRDHDRSRRLQVHLGQAPQNGGERSSIHEADEGAQDRETGRQAQQEKIVLKDTLRNVKVE
jgi:hypothetical protein